MKKILIVCESRYGSTLETGRWIAQRLPYEQTTICPVNEAPAPDGYDLVILGSGVYQDTTGNAIISYAMDHREQLKDLPLAVFAVCLDTRGVYKNGQVHGGWAYLEKLLAVFNDHPPLHADLLRGELDPATLSDEDRRMLLFFYNKILNRNIETIPYVTRMDKSRAWAYAETVLDRWIDAGMS